MWYFENPGRGAATLGAHVFNGFTIDFPRTYIRDLNLPAGPLAGSFWAVFTFGFIEVLRAVGRVRVAREPAAVYVAATCGLTVALLAITAVETRFNVIPMSVLVVGAAWGVVRPGWDSARTRALIVAGAVGLLGAVGASFMRGIMTTAPCC